MRRRFFGDGLRLFFGYDRWKALRYTSTFRGIGQSQKRDGWNDEEPSRNAWGQFFFELIHTLCLADKLRRFSIITEFLVQQIAVKLFRGIADLRYEDYASDGGGRTERKRNTEVRSGERYVLNGTTRGVE